MTTGKGFIAQVSGKSGNTLHKTRVYESRNEAAAAAFTARPKAKSCSTCKAHNGEPSDMDIRYHNRPAKKAVKEGVAFLIENELERAEVVLAAKGITQKLQDFAENLSKIEANEIMPMLDSFRTTFGPQAADQFSQVATGKIRELIGAVQTSKNAIDNEISRLEQMVNGGGGSDAELDASVPPAPPGGDLPSMDAKTPAADLPPSGEPSGDAMDPSADPTMEPDAGATGFAGRARKESATIKGRRLAEANTAESSEFKTNLDNLAAFSPKLYTMSHDILDRIHDLAVSGDVRNKLMQALGHIVSMADSKDVWDDPETVANTGVETYFVGAPMSEVINTPEVANIVKSMRRLAHKIASKHEGDLNEDDLAPPSPAMPAASVAPASSPLAAGPVFEARRAKNIKRLRESHNPDKMILTVFRKVFKECRNVVAAANGTARAFNIDLDDVVSIVREAKAKKVEEDAVPSLMGVEMGQPDGGTQNPNAALMGQNPTAANPQPGKPNKPMTPADMRAAKLSQDAQDQAAAANGQPNQPLVPAKTNVPVQQVKGQQTVQTVTPQMQQQMRANGNAPLGKKPITMPGKVVTNNNIGTV